MVDIYILILSCKLNYIDTVMSLNNQNYCHTGKCIRRFGGIYAYCRYFIDRKW